MAMLLAGLGIGALLGGNKSEQIQKSLTEVVNKHITNISMSSKTTINKSQSSKQVQNINLTGAKLSGNCKLDFSQDMTSKLTSIVELTDEQKNDLATKIQNHLTEKFKQGNEQKAAGFSFGSNTQKQTIESDSKTINKITKNIETAIEKNIDISQGSVQIQNVILEKAICDQNASASFKQKMVVEQISKDISKNVMENVVKTEALTKKELAAEQRNKQITEGITGCGSSCLPMLCCCIIPLVLGYCYRGHAALAAGCIILLCSVVGSIYDYTKTEDKDKGSKTLRMVRIIVLALVSLGLIGYGGYTMVAGGTCDLESIKQQGQQMYTQGRQMFTSRTPAPVPVSAKLTNRTPLPTRRVGGRRGGGTKQTYFITSKLLSY